MSPELLSYKEAGQLVGVTGRRMAQLAKAGHIEHGPKRGRAHTVLAASVEAYMGMLLGKKVFGGKRFIFQLDDLSLARLSRLGLRADDIPGFVSAAVSRAIEEAEKSIKQPAVL